MPMRKNPTTGVMEWVNDSFIFNNDISINPDKNFMGDTISYEPKAFENDLNITKNDSFNWDTLFDSKNLSGTLQGVGAVTGAVGQIYQSFLTKEYQDDIFKLEKNRVDKETKKQDKQQDEYDKVWSS